MTEEMKSEQLSEKEKKPVIVEIGSSDSPIHYFSVPIWEKIKEGAMVYVGVDMKKEDLKKAKEQVGNYVVGYAEEMPFKSNSVDEIWAYNVFGDQKTMSNETTFAELARVIKPGGRIIIGETLTPTTYLMDRDYGQYGLKKEILVGEELRKFLEQYHLAHAIDKEPIKGQPQFFLILKKKTNGI